MLPKIRFFSLLHTHDTFDKYLSRNRIIRRRYRNMSYGWNVRRNTIIWWNSWSLHLPWWYWVSAYWQLLYLPHFHSGMRKCLQSDAQTMKGLDKFAYRKLNSMHVGMNERAVIDIGNFVCSWLWQHVRKRTKWCNRDDQSISCFMKFSSFSLRFSVCTMRKCFRLIRARIVGIMHKEKLENLRLCFWFFKFCFC